MYLHCKMLNFLCEGFNKILSYRRDIALQSGLIMAQSGRLELGDNIRGHYRSMFNHRDVIARQSAAKQSNSVKKNAK